MSVTVLKMVNVDENFLNYQFSKSYLYESCLCCCCLLLNSFKNVYHPNSYAKCSLSDIQCHNFSFFEKVKSLQVICMPSKKDKKRDNFC